MQNIDPIHPIELQRTDALIIVDVQNCFLPGGSLGVAGGDRIIEPLNRAIGIFFKKNLAIFLSRDWHPRQHISFVEQGGPWPVHCVRNTSGAQFFESLRIPASAVVFSKGTDPEQEEYSAWHARDASGKTLQEIVHSMGIQRLFIGGLTTEYCILSTVKDARAEGYPIFVLQDAICAVEANQGDGWRALEEMSSAKAELIMVENIRP